MRGNCRNLEIDTNRNRQGTSKRSESNFTQDFLVQDREIREYIDSVVEATHAEFEKAQEVEGSSGITQSQQRDAGVFKSNRGNSTKSKKYSLLSGKYKHLTRYFKKFNNKNLEFWTPVYTPNYLICIYIIIGVTLISVGIYIQLLSNSTIECLVNYQDSPGYGKTIDTVVELGSNNCNPSVIKGSEIKYFEGEFYLYYQLRNFYQNDKNFINNKSEKQLAGKIIFDEKKLSSCYPLIKDNDGRIYYPCGTAARAIFNDTFTIHDGEGDPIEIDDSIETLTFSSDKKKFKNIPEEDIIKHNFNDWLSKELFPGRIENPHFIVWMKVSAFSTFNKVYGKLISKKNRLILPLKISIKNRYPAFLFNGSKHIVISQITSFGGKHSNFGVTYILTGVVFILVSIYYIIRNKQNNIALGDFRYLYWSNS
ncbi:ligand-effect modulator 3 domain containing protein [Cryptosporidium felis]|nr:ligand-effect modulator 3 domain containing protein [Cryptosporidium felis]